MLIAAGPGILPFGPVSNMQLMDVTPTILRLFDMEVPPDMQGHVIEAIAAANPAIV
jgi:predicted AlkP superfamily phosphohydrolase/phosphomutase